jgi:hypothetical protein
MKIRVQITVSHNEVTENYSIMSEPSTISFELNEEKSKVWNEIKSFNPNIMLHWGQQIWDLLYPNTVGKVFKYKILN